MMYAEDVIVWWTHVDLVRQQAGPQATLDKTSYWCTLICLTLCIEDCLHVHDQLIGPT